MVWNRPLKEKWLPGVCQAVEVLLCHPVVILATYRQTLEGKQRFQLEMLNRRVQMQTLVDLNYPKYN
jgi:hypothetical protein